MACVVFVVTPEKPRLVPFPFTKGFFKLSAISKKNSRVRKGRKDERERQPEKKRKKKGSSS